MEINSKQISVCRVSKEQFANMLEHQVRTCLENAAPLGALAVIYMAIDFMAGKEKMAQWIDKYMPKVPDRLNGDDFYRSRSMLFHVLTIHDPNRARKREGATPLLFHYGASPVQRYVLVSSAWEDGDLVLNAGTSFIDIERFVNAFVTGMKAWVDGEEDMSKFVFPILADTRPKRPVQ